MVVDRRARAGAASLELALVCAALFWPAAAAADAVDRWSVEIASASERFGVPQQWIRRVMRAESEGQVLLGGRPIVSRAGAMGLMQLMPTTWNEMRVLLGLGTDPYDPHDNIAAGTAYLRLMYDRYGYPGLFAAYNAGPTRYSAYLARRRTLPIETRAYMAAVSAPRRLAAIARPRQTPVLTVTFRGRLAAADARPFLPTSACLFVTLGSASGR
jgi:soluble lytic murein transglycosylase-like protein